MPLLKSAKKAMKQNIKLRKKNRAQKVEVKQALKDATKMLKQGKVKEVKEKMPSLYKMVDKAAKRGIFHKKNASNKKSALAKALNAAEKK